MADVVAILDFRYFLQSFESADLSVQEKKLKIDFLFLAMVAIFFIGAYHLANLVESHLGNIIVKFDWNWSRG